MKKNLLITGVSGLLGNNLAYYLKSRYPILGLYNQHPVQLYDIQSKKCDLTDIESVRNIIAGFRPEIIIHCASLTNIESCEKNQHSANQVNYIGTRNIVDAVSNMNVLIIYISTDSVYKGDRGNYTEEDTVSPQNYYGHTKYSGEKEVRRNSEWIIFRTNLFGWNIQNKESLAEWILYSLKNGKRIKGFKDAQFSTIYTMELSRIIDMAIRKGLRGVYNCGSKDSCSKYEFALKLAQFFGLPTDLITPISIDDYEFKAKRGKNLTLNVSKLCKDLEYDLPEVMDCLKSFYRDYKSELNQYIGETIPKESPRAKKFIQYGRQWIDSTDIKEVTDVLRSGRITQGPKIEEFETSLKDYIGVRHAIVLNSGTSGLHIACLSVGLQPGDEVITSPITFVASANCAVYCGAIPVFADIDPETYNLTPESLEQKISSRTKAVIPVHFSGQSCRMDVVQNVVRQAEKQFGHKIYIIEDGCHALGSRYMGTNVGSCAYSDMTVMSFHPVKHITTGEGGVVVTNDIALAKKLRCFRSHGITSACDEFIFKDQAFDRSGSEPVVNPWYYEQQNLGYNYRITDIQCALGTSQLKKIETFRKRRREIVDTYNDAFRDTEHIKRPYEFPLCDSNFHLYVLLFDFEKIGISRAKFINHLNKNGIQTQVHYIPVHTQPFYQQNFNTKWGDCPEAETYYRKCLSIPLFPEMTALDIEKVIREIKSLVGGNS